MTAARGRSALTIAALLGIVVAALVVLLATRDPATERATQTPLLGKLAPSTAGTTIDGRQVSIDDYRGRFVVVNFFGSWCVPCQLEHRELMAFDEEHRAAGDAVLVGVTFDDKAKDARAFFAERGGSWPVIDDPENSIGVAYGVAQVPESWVIAPDGTVVERFAGEVTQEDLDRSIARFSGIGQ
jgi:cytochrome c biogenesis protein CcmG/thiol:disulfide interchange protein DsbE